MNASTTSFVHMRRGVLRFLVAVMTLAIAMLGWTAPARAENDVSIGLAVQKLVKSDADGTTETNEQLKRWDVAKLVVDWDAQNTVIKSGTSFTITLPEPFDFRGYPRTDVMQVTDPGGVEREIGACVTERSQMVCTFNEQAQSLYDAGFRKFTGTNSMLLNAVKTHASEVITFDLNGKLVVVDLPGEGGIAVPPFEKARLWKWINKEVLAGQTQNRWVIKFGTDYLRENMKPEGSFKTDGSISTLTLHDVMAASQAFDGSRSADTSLVIGGSEEDPDLWEELWNLQEGSKKVDWQVEFVTNSSNNVDITITGPFPPSTNMTLYLPVAFLEPAKPGVIYNNTVTAQGVDKVTTGEAYYVDTVEITVRMEPGYGTFKVQKLVTGSGAPLVDANAKFKLNVDFKLPQKYSQYNPEWQPPAGFTIDPDGVTGNGSIMISPGKNTYFDPIITLPVGTEVTLSEDPEQVTPAAPVTWGTPVFDKKTFTIGDQKVESIKLTNEALKRPVVSVGDYVWEDLNADGIQDDGEPGIKDVVLLLQGPDGDVPNDVFGKPVNPVKTDEHGKYIFENLPALQDGQSYKVIVDKNSEALKPFIPTPTDHAGEDRAKDSDAIAGFAESQGLTNDGDSDLTLDFGYIRVVPSIDIEKYSDDLATGDADTPDTAIALAADESKTITFAVSNSGDEDLIALKFQDQTTTGSAVLQDLKCTLNGVEVAGVDGVVAFDPAAILKVGDKFTCTATLPALGAGALHADNASINADGAASGISVKDEDPWHAKTPKAAVSVGDFVFEDVNKDGVQDDGDKPIKDVTLTISRTDGASVNKSDGTPAATTTTTDADGKYVFEGLEVLPAGTHYVVSVTAPSGFVPTKDAQGGDPAKDSSAEAGKAESVDLVNDGDSDLTLDFGYVKAVPSIDVEKYSGDVATGDADTPETAVEVAKDASTTVSFDVVNDGNEDLNNLTFKDVASDGPSLTELKCTLNGVEVVGVDGVVAFDPAAVLKVGDKFTCTATLAAMGAGMTHADTVTVEGDGVASGVPVKDEDPWHAKTPKAAVSVGDFVFEDVNKDGVQDDGDKPIKDVTLTISRTDGASVNKSDGTPAATTTTTDADGKYVFEGLEVLPAGTHYVVSVTAPSGFVPTKDAQGGDPAKDSSAEAGKAESVDLVNDGDSDLTLDFGYVKAVPSIDVEKYSGDVATGDADTPETAVEVAKDASTTVSFDVVNDGNEDLNNLTFKDVASDGPSLTELKCTLNGVEVVGVDGVVAFDPAAVLKVGDKFTCTATLAAMGAGMTHADTVTVEGDGVASGVPVKDEDPWHAKTPMGKVTVGDFVWEDVDKDGVQGPSEPGIKDVELTLVGPDGNPVTDVDGNPVAPVKTDENGKYEFSNLPVLPAGKHYTVKVTAPKGYNPTVDGATSSDKDSSAQAGMAESTDLVKDGDKDLTLDFGYVKATPSIMVKKYSDSIKSGDAQTTETAVALKADEAKTVTFEVTNDGTEDLNHLTFKDVASDGPALIDLKCTLNGAEAVGKDGVVAFDPAAVLKVGDKYTCTATLAAMGEGKTHADTVTVGGTGVGTGTPVADDDPWHALTPPPATPSNPAKGLSKTGSNAVIVMSIAGVVLLAGGVVLGLTRRRR